MPDAGKLPAVILALAASFLVVVLFVFLRPRAESPSAPEEPAVPEAPHVETPAPPAADTTGITEAVSELVDEAVYEYEHRNDPPDLAKAMAAWKADEQSRIDVIAQETFEETLHMMADWDTNYYKLILGDTDVGPSAPGCAMYIAVSRRFAKLLEDCGEEMSQALASEVATCLEADLETWKQLSDSGQSLRATIVYFGRDGFTNDELIFPVTYRINASLFLLGNRPSRAALPVVLESADVLGLDTNWSLVSYACDRAMTSADREALSAGRQRVLDSYFEWRGAEENKEFFTYKVMELPSYRSAARPFDRATSLGAPVESMGEPVKIEIPLIYRVYLVPTDSGEIIPKDPTGNTDIAKKVVDFARRFVEAGE